MLIVTRGYGSTGTIGEVVTRGYTIGVVTTIAAPSYTAFWDVEILMQSNYSEMVDLDTNYSDELELDPMYTADIENG